MNSRRGSSPKGCQLRVRRRPWAHGRGEPHSTLPEDAAQPDTISVCLMPVRELSGCPGPDHSTDRRGPSSRLNHRVSNRPMRRVSSVPRQPVVRPETVGLVAAIFDKLGKPLQARCTGHAERRYIDIVCPFFIVKDKSIVRFEPGECATGDDRITVKRSASSHRPARHPRERRLCV